MDQSTHIEFEGFEVIVSCLKEVRSKRFVVAVAGPPGGGKSTFSEKLISALNESELGCAAILPMDGFHYDDTVLIERDLRDRKGSPPTFDVSGLMFLLRRIKNNLEMEIAVPVFDRSLELSRAGARIIPQSARIVIVEGNYLLLNAEPWQQLRALFDLSIFVSEDKSKLEDRLVRRWVSYGFDLEGARKKVFNNDLLNIELVLSESVAPDFLVWSS